MGANFNFFITVKHVELGKRDFVRALAAYAVTRCNYVERSYPSRSASSRAVLAASLSEFYRFSSKYSQVKGPAPTQLEYAFIIPIELVSFKLGTPAPMGAYAAIVDDDEV